MLRFEVERRERRFEDLRVGFSDAELGGNDRDLERRRERRVRELLPLDVGCAVGHERESMVQREISHHRFRIGIDQLNLAARDAVGIRGRVDEGIVDDRSGGERSAPDAAAEVRDKRPQCAQSRGIANELTPERLSPPDTHRVRIGEHGRRAEKRLGGFAGRRGQDFHLGAHPVGDPQARLSERALRRLVFEQQRVIKVEENGTDYCLVRHSRDS